MTIPNIPPLQRSITPTLHSRRPMSEERPVLSLVVPVYNEEDNLRPLTEAIREAMKTVGVTYEVVLTDDGSGGSVRHVGDARRLPGGRR